MRPHALILESTFTSARDMAGRIFPRLSRLIVLRYRFETRAWMKEIHCPVMILHSSDDEIVPFEMGEELYRLARAPKRFFRMQGGHNDAFLRSQPGYRRALADFIQRPGSSS